MRAVTPDEADDGPADEERDSAPRHDRFALSPEEYDQLRAHVPWLRRAYLDLLVLHGLAVEAIERLTPADLDAQSRILRVGSDSGADEQHIAVDLRTVYRVLAQQRATHAKRLVPPWPTIAADLQTACDLACIVRRTVADVRHSYTVWSRTVAILDSTRAEERANENGLPH